MTAHLLNSPLKDQYQLIHFNISKGREVDTKARFDAINVIYGLFQPIQLFWLMVKHKPDAVYTNWAQNLAGFLRYASFIWIVALFRRPIVVRVMGDGFNYFYARANPILRWLIRLTLSKVSRFIVRAEILKQQFAGAVPDKKLCVVYTGIDVKEFDRLGNNQRNDCQNSDVRVLFVGYLTQAKGAFDLLKAVSLVVAKEPNVAFQFMGAKLDVERNITYIANPASNEDVLQRLLSQPEIAKHVELLGTQSGKEKIETFVNADIFVMPSYSETTPVVALEAMAARLPVVATPVGLLPHAFDERNILFFEPGNVSQLAENILQLVRDPARRKKMGAYNQVMVKQRFDLEAYAARLEQLFDELLRI